MNVSLSTGNARAGILKGTTVLPFWTYALLVMLCTLVGLSCLGQAIRWVGRPFPGFLLSSDRSVHALGRRSWPGSQAGLDPSHRLVAGNRHPVADSGDAYALVDSLAPGSSVHWRFQEAGRDRMLTLPVRIFSGQDFLLVYLPPFLAGVLILGAAAWVVWTRPAERAAWVYLLISVLAAIANFALFDSASDYVFTDLWVISIALSAAPLLHLGLIFPQEHPWLRRFPWLETLPYGLMLGLVMVAQGVNTWVYSPDRARQFFILEITAPSLATVALIALLLRSWALAPHAHTRRQVEAVGLGIAAGFGLPAVWALAFAAGHPLANLSLILACSAAFPLSIGYAIVRHRLFEIGAALRRLSAYTGVTLILGGAYLVAVGLAVPALEAWWLPAPAPRILQAVLMVLVGAAIRPVQAALQQGIDGLFCPGHYRRERQIAGFFRHLQHGIPLEELVPALQQFLIDTFHPCRAAVLLQANRGKDTPPPTAGYLQIPMVVDKRRVGLIHLGPRTAGGEYSREDLDLLETVATSGAIAVERARYASQAIDLAVKHRLIQERAAWMERLNAVVNHELKGPLQLVRRMVADLKGEWPEYVAAGRPGRVVETLDRIGAAALRLEKFVQRNLDRSALQAGELRLHLEAVDTTGLVRALVERYGPEWQRRSQSIDLDLPGYLPRAEADRERLEHVLENLLSNAIKYTPPGGRIAIQGRMGDHGLYLQVRDTGIGIAEADRERVFEPFGKLDGTDRASTGLGLSICREYIRRMRGDIRLASHPGRGSTFTLMLPIRGGAGVRQYGRAEGGGLA